MSNRIPWRIWLLPMLLVLPATPVLAQSLTAAQPAQEAPEASGPTPIPVSEFTRRADTDERYAEQAIRLVREPDPTIRLSTSLDAIDTSVRGKARLLGETELESLPVLRLESLERHWKFDARQYDSWRNRLQDAGQPYVDDAAELARRRADWQATRADAPASGLAPALDAQAAAIEQKLKDAEDALATPLANLLALGRRGNVVEAEILSGERTTAQVIERNDRRMFTRTAPPWPGRAGTDDGQGAEAALAGVTVEAQFAANYSAANQGNQRALRVLALILLPLLLWLSWSERRRVRLAETPAGDDGLHRILRRPISSWLLLCMVGLLVLEPDAPLLIHQLATIVALVPVLRLIPPEGYRLLGAWPFAASGLFLLLRLAFFISADPHLYRSYMLLLALLGAGGLTSWLVWRARNRAPNMVHGRISRFIGLLAWLSIIVLGVSVIANLVGAVALGEMLVSGVIDSGFMGLMLYVGVTVFNALLKLLIERREHTRMHISHDPAQPLLTTLMQLARIAAVIGWVVFTMNRFRIFRPVYAWCEAVLTHKFTFGAISLSLGHIAVFVVSVFVAFWTAKTVRLLLRDKLLAKMTLPRGVAHSIASLTYYALIMLGLFVALAAAGFKVSQLTLVVGALGVGIGLGLQDVVKNFVSGLILMFERPIQPGDVVDITGISGRVHDIGMRATTIKTFDGADVVVPNGSLLASNLTNWTLRDMMRRIEIQVGVAYGTDPVQVSELLLEMAGSTEGITTQPPPLVLFTGFGASSLDFVVRGWTYDYDNWAVIRSNMMVRAHAALRQAGIEIPFPQQDLHLRTVSPEAGVALTRRPAERPELRAEPRSEPKPPSDPDPVP